MYMYRGVSRCKLSTGRSVYDACGALPSYLYFKSAEHRLQQSIVLRPRNPQPANEYIRPTAMPSDLNQELYLGGLLEGLKFTIVDVTPSVPDRSGWGATFSNPSAGSKTSNGNGDFDYLHCPFEIKGGEKIGTTKLTANSGLYSTGQGGKVDIKFHLEGKTTVNGSEVHINDDGYISVSASDWKGLERPDVSNVTYYWPNSPPCNAALTVPPSIAGMPDDIFFVHAAKPDAKELGMTSTTHQEVVDMVLNYAIRGIFWVNEKLFSWAIGPFKPF